MHKLWAKATHVFTPLGRENHEQGREDDAEDSSGTWAISAFCASFPSAFISVVLRFLPYLPLRVPQLHFSLCKTPGSREMMANEMAKPQTLPTAQALCYGLMQILKKKCIAA